MYFLSSVDINFEDPTLGLGDNISINTMLSTCLCPKETRTTNCYHADGLPECELCKPEVLLNTELVADPEVRGISSPCLF